MNIVDVKILTALSVRVFLLRRARGTSCDYVILLLQQVTYPQPLNSIIH